MLAEPTGLPSDQLMTQLEAGAAERTPAPAGGVGKLSPTTGIVSPGTPSGGMKEKLGAVVGVNVGVKVGVSDGVAVSVGVNVGVSDGVAVNVGVKVGVSDGVAVNV